jgi:hypothetical protein
MVDLKNLGLKVVMKMCLETSRSVRTEFYAFGAVQMQPQTKRQKPPIDSTGDY